MFVDSVKPKVLYVDDDDENLLVFRSSFRRYYDVLTANNTLEANKYIQSTNVDIIISDQRMPDMTGVDFLKSLPDDKENVRIIMTGYSDIGAVVDALNSGKIYKYIPKPWDKEQLKEIISDACKYLQQKKEKSNGSVSGTHSETREADQSVHIVQLKKQVEEAYKNVHLLSEIGQEIISKLTVEEIIESTYENVNAIMDASVFLIGVYDAENEALRFPGVIEKGEKIPYPLLSIYAEDKPAAWCFMNRAEFFTNDYPSDFNNYFKGKLSAMAGDLSLSLIYLPLIEKDKTIGVISVQSFRKDAYTSYHLNMLRNISIYVATALENAAAYHTIEKHKAEIEQKNIELEQKVELRTLQLQQKNNEVMKQKDELEGTYRNVKLLSEIGRQITSTLSLVKIMETVYENVNNLMDASIFGIGVYNPVLNRIEFPGSMEKGVRLQPWFATMDEDNRLAVKCFKDQKEIIINDYELEYDKYVKTIAKPKAGELPESIIYLPLVTNEGTIGTISVQSFKKHVYNHYHIDILRSLASYITIAIQNASSYQKMTEAFEELKKAQTKLVESEKMASLGVLTAGVAHEINNPVNFISGGIQSLEENYAELESLLHLLLQYHTVPNESLSVAINQKKKELQVQKLLAEIEELIASIKNGANRTAEIVKGLRNFSRLDEDDMKRANLEEGLDSTLVILNTQLKNRVEVVKEYGHVPEINCYPGQLNQVFMNIIYNASDAIEGKGKIYIKTSIENDCIKVSIRDTGKGMPEAVRSRIFEPFFTTKAVGKGTGLGLSIAYGIIEKHKGIIEVESEDDKGTQFTISLPIK